MSNLTFTFCALFTLFITTFIGGCERSKQTSEKRKAATNPPRTVYLVLDTGKLKKESFEDIHLYYHDLFSRGHMPALTGTLVKLPLKTPTTLVNADEKQTFFLVYPGEWVHLRYTRTDSMQLFIPGNEQRTRELDFFRQLIQKTGSLYYALTVMPYHQKVAGPDAFHGSEGVINQVKNQRLNFLKTYASRYKLSDGFTQLAAHSIKSAAINDSLLLYKSNRPWLIKQGDYQRLVKAKILALMALGYSANPSFFAACSNTVRFGLGGAPGDRYVEDTTALRRHFNYIQQEFTGRVRSFLWASTLYNAVFNNVPIAQTYWQTFLSQSDDAIYNALVINLKNSENSTKNFKPGTNQLLGRDGETTLSFDSLLARHQNKLILLDFWASWCGPCRAEIPDSKKLQQQYTGKNIAFVNISTDAVVSDWQKAVQEESIDTPESYLLLKSDQSPLVKRYSIYSIPRYMLVGKNGKIINTDAPRPSEPKLKQLIDRNL